MCGRYSLNDADQIPERFDAEVSKGVELKPNFNVAPTQTMVVITENSDGKRVVESMKWGIPRVLGKDLVKELINTRSDKAFGGFWKKTVCNQRCLIPASGFYEWRGSKGNKTPYFIHPKHDELFAFAGIWSTWKDDDGHESKVYSIMTTEAGKDMQDLHSREPVILHKDDESKWLTSSHNNDRLALEAVLHPYEDNGLEIYEVSRDVNVVRNNNNKLFLPLNNQ